MNCDTKVTPEHLKRTAYLYIRQSTLRQVFENTESTHRQYGLKQKAIVLGWPEERIEVIDCDQAHSADSALERDGFQRLVAEVGLGKAGIVMGLEVSRLARNCADWHRLMQICAITNTLILDQDGLYDPGQFNDRLVLGLKATMSEAELHILKARLRGGINSKAQRGELKMALPIGLIYDPAQRVVMDPDKQVQGTVRLFFETFRRCGSAWATVKEFKKQGLKFPKHGQAGSGEVIWEQMRHSIALDTLRNPRYAGAFCFGRSRTWKDPDGKWHCVNLPREKWLTLIKDAHAAYISWEEYEENQKRLQQNRSVPNRERSGPPREGPALLQGLVVCAKCGGRMTVCYHHRKGKLSPNYICQKASVEDTHPVCQNVPGDIIDEAVGKLIIESVTPLCLEVSLQVQQQLQSRLAEADRLRHQRVERAQYEADQARIRYMRVDPNNRLVADTLEALWNEKLRQLAEAKDEYDKQSKLDQRAISEEQKQQILALARDFPQLWNDPKTTHRDRKRMARLLVEDVSLKRDQSLIMVQARFKGGATKVFSLPMSLSAPDLRRTKQEIVAEIDRLLNDMSDPQIAAELNRKGLKSSLDNQFSAWMVYCLRRSHGLKSRRERLRELGLLNNREVAQLVGTKPLLVDYWREKGLLKGTRLNEKNEYFYERPDNDTVQAIKQRTRVNKPKACPGSNL